MDTLKFTPPIKIVIAEREILAKIVETWTGSATTGGKLLTMSLEGISMTLPD
ncbi:MAG: hypothetical protein ACWGOY_05335 [Anaerolineales bacterium]